MLWFFNLRRHVGLWICQHLLGLYHCIHCGAIIYLAGNNDEQGNVWCERCANDGLIAEDARRAAKQEKEWRGDFS